MYKVSTYSIDFIYCLPAMYNCWATLAMGRTSYHVMVEFQQVHWVRSAVVRPRSVVILGDPAFLLTLKINIKHNCITVNYLYLLQLKSENLVVSLPGKTCVACLLLFF